MPKIIKDLRARIINTAIHIFNEEGFNAIDMRKIARECKIAVGTLYNYFPKKKELMYEVFNNLWKESMDELDRFMEESQPGESLLENYITAFHREMDKKKGIGKELFRLELIESKEDKIDEESLFSYSNHQERYEQIRKVLKKSFELEDSQMNGKDFEKIINTCLILIMLNKSSGEDYALFLKDLMSSYVEKYMKNDGRLC